MRELRPPMMLSRLYRPKFLRFSRKAGKAAIVATAHKIARIIYQTGPEDHLHQCGLKTTVLDRCRMVAHGTEVSKVRSAYLRTRAKDVVAMFVIYHLRTHRTPFRHLIAEDDEQRARERDLADLRKRAAKIGLTLVESPA